MPHVDSLRLWFRPIYHDVHRSCMWQGQAYHTLWCLTRTRGITYTWVMTNTCQICGRSIKATTGLIAHHGYQRPHKQGWQSGSCFGARALPYELSCDRLPLAISRCKVFIKNQKNHLDDFIKNPPSYIIVSDTWGIGGRKDFNRPEGYIYNPERGSFSRDEMYAMNHHSTISEINRSIKGAENELPRLEKRLIDWVTPTFSKECKEDSHHYCRDKSYACRCGLCQKN